ncbi:ABC transporter permease [Emticicia fluvialis]|uniref:ABC transporter permease n=1 Tax=Emticicia fluvialis TaxID=2974474 RepID=UPI002166762B|nr:ABC transporter permease [Emticicia fluvialis]
MQIFIHSFQSEWLKKKGTLAFWLVFVGAFFIPLIFTCRGLFYPADFLAEAKTPVFWDVLQRRSWQFMAIFLLPMGVILSTSLITQLEFRNNTWKQLHTTPQSYTTVFFSKFAVIIVMLLQFFVLFNIGIYLSALIPSLVRGNTDFFKHDFPLLTMLENTSFYFLDCLPIVAIQYLVSLQFKNFLVPFSVGIGLLLTALIGLQWKYGYTIPYTYTQYYLFSGGNQGSPRPPQVNFHYWALGYFIGFTLLGYLLYISKKEKG